MRTKDLTEVVQKTIRDIARGTRCDFLDNRRLVLNDNPTLFYQPDFVLLKQSSLIIVEIELSTDARKSITGDIVRAGLTGASIFIGIAKDAPTATAIETYGKVLTSRISEISSLRVIGLAALDEEFIPKMRTILQ